MFVTCGIAFIRSNEDRWKAIYAYQESSAKYYREITEKLAELHDEELPEFAKARNDAFSMSDDDGSAEENDYASDNKGDTILDFADQGGVGKAQPPPAVQGLRRPSAYSGHSLDSENA